MRGRYRLERYHPAQFAVPGLIDYALSAAAQFTQQFVVGKFRVSGRMCLLSGHIGRRIHRGVEETTQAERLRCRGRHGGSATLASTARLPDFCGVPVDLNGCTHHNASELFSAGPRGVMVTVPTSDQLSRLVEESISYWRLRPPLRVNCGAPFVMVACKGAGSVTVRICLSA